MISLGTWSAISRNIVGNGESHHVSITLGINGDLPCEHVCGFDLTAAEWGDRHPGLPNVVLKS
jgi:hypothetical protein